MSKIQRIFDKNSDSDSSTSYSDSDLDYDTDLEEDDIEDDDEDKDNDEKDEDNDDDDSDDNDNEYEEDQEDDDGDDEIEDDEDDDEKNEDESDGFEFDSADEVSDNEGGDIPRNSSKNKTIEVMMKVNEVKNSRCYQKESNVREPGKNFLIKLFKEEEFTRDLEKLEKSMYNYCVRTLREKHSNVTLESKIFKDLYTFELYSIMSHCKKGLDVDDIRDFYLQDKNHFERCTFEKERLQDEKKLRLITHVSEPVSGIHKCKCGCDKVYSYELQTRSGDEGMTVFLQCFSCGRKWKL
jgi:DNA-directed RNA polymerase subunit M/transcription elongation factor TFIIS